MKTKEIKNILEDVSKENDVDSIKRRINLFQLEKVWHTYCEVITPISFKRFIKLIFKDNMNMQMKYYAEYVEAQKSFQVVNVVERDEMKVPLAMIPFIDEVFRCQRNAPTRALKMIRNVSNNNFR